LTGKLLPTGNTTDTLDVEGEGKFEVSLVDAGISMVFIRAEALGLKESETPMEIDADKKLLISDVRPRRRSKT
jgi:2-methylaconitate isomerase